MEEQRQKPVPAHLSPPESEEDHAKTPSPVSSAGGDSGVRSLSSTSLVVSEELRTKMNQLEEEIGRCRAENASLEKLRKEREEVCPSPSCTALDRI